MSEKDKKDLSGAAADMDEVMRKYDRESATRIWEGVPKIVVQVISALFSLGKHCRGSVKWKSDHNG